jgi:septal ring factor EnvC (AmiA/AmiB activator)
VIYINVALALTALVAALSAFGGDTWRRGSGRLLRRITKRGWVAVVTMILAFGLAVSKEVIVSQRQEMDAKELARLKDANRVQSEELDIQLKEIADLQHRLAVTTESIAKTTERLFYSTDKLFSDLEAARLSSSMESSVSSFDDARGVLPWPLEGNLVRRFGRYIHQDYGTVAFNTGIDVATKPKTPIIAVYDGKVEYADSLPGYGVTVILNHGSGFYTLYSHIGDAWVDQEQNIRGGSILGLSVNSDGEMHFEIREGKKALDPLLWLKPRAGS